MDNKENNFEHIINNQPEESMMIQNIEETPEQLQESHKLYEFNKYIKQHGRKFT